MNFIDFSSSQCQYVDNSQSAYKCTRNNIDCTEKNCPLYYLVKSDSGVGPHPVEQIVIPPIKYCAYCGSEDIKFVKRVPRCNNCRCVFFVNFLRHLRKQEK